jgi:divalent metal cation (Fe/Co/Zn/Cd) transporter
MRAPTPEEKAKEDAILYTTLADVAIVLVTFLFAVLTLSLTLIGETLRMTLMMGDVYTFFVLRAVHRDQLRKYRFGIGKVEQVCNLGIGVALVVGGLWVAQQVFDTLLFGQDAASPLGLAIAAVVSAVNTLINVLGWFAMRVAARHDDSLIYRAQLRSRMVSVVASLIVQATLTVAVLVKDPLVSVWLDGLGATFVAWIMLSIGLRMMWEATPDLLDRAVPDRVGEQIRSVLATAGLAPEEPVRMRTRRSGGITQVELALDPGHCRSMAEFTERAGRVQRLVESRVPAADVSIVVAARDG